MAVPPGSRNSPRLTPGAKGKTYAPTKTDKRQTGARSRSTASKWGQQTASSTLRNIAPGYGGHDSLKTLGAGIYEEEQSTYTLGEQKEEEKLFQLNESLRSFMSDLEKKLLTEQKNNED